MPSCCYNGSLLVAKAIFDWGAIFHPCHTSTALAGCVTGHGLHQPILCEVILGDNDKLVLSLILHSYEGESDSGLCSIYIDEYSSLGHVGPEHSTTQPTNHSLIRPAEMLAVAESRTFFSFFFSHSLSLPTTHCPNFQIMEK